MDAPITFFPSSRRSARTEAPAAPVQRFHTLSVILKVTERCNLACPYCYFYFSGDDTHREHPAFADDEMLSRTLAFILDAVREQGIRQVQIGLHGGEPLLLKPARFDALCQTLRDAIEPVCELMLLVQTNGVLLDARWVEILSRHRIRVGVSIDGDAQAHDRTRITKKGRGTYAETLRGWRLLNEAVKEGRAASASILAVVAPDRCGAATYRHFREALDADGMNFLLPDLTHDAPEASPAHIEACGDFLIGVYNAWVELGGSSTRGSVRFIEELVGPLLDDQLCRRAALGRRVLPNQFAISTDGEICPDDVIRGFAPRLRQLPYRVGIDSAAALRETPVWLELIEAQSSLPAACSGCLWRNVCGGGALAHRYSHANGFDNPSVYCAGLKKLYRHVAWSLIQAGASEDAIERRLTTDWTQTAPTQEVSHV
ncbi:radical SAM protein [Mitsuaria sp. WAJ17]|uniref:radical SAM protein n=1 Tax=Mitsuaria sp. WAJ17 TaxID=2761452 RepID=UPI001602933C|nr:radical SAM protein [Mitsuaria sp. WAJ17]MBB2484686.1 radical SAM protein [Mitsuaria sp. WAJ17]